MLTDYGDGSRDETYPDRSQASLVAFPLESARVRYLPQALCGCHIVTSHLTTPSTDWFHPPLVARWPQPRTHAFSLVSFSPYRYALARLFSKRGGREKQKRDTSHFRNKCPCGSPRSHPPTPVLMAGVSIFLQGETSKMAGWIFGRTEKWPKTNVSFQSP